LRGLPLLRGEPLKADFDRAFHHFMRREVTVFLELKIDSKNYSGKLVIDDFFQAFVAKE
jgi:hypothetical protein